MTRVRVLASAAFALALPIAARAQSRPHGVNGWTAFADEFDSYNHVEQVVGAAAVLGQGSRTVCSLSYGLADERLHQPVDTNTIFHWASTTKLLTAISILQLRDQGVLTLDDPVTRYVPELRRVHDEFGSIDTITIRMLLSHSSGFQNGTWPYSRGKAWEPFEPHEWEQLVAMMPYQEIGFAPGSRFSYSNPAFIYLGKIIERLTGDPYEVYIQKNIWTPLAMAQSYFGTTPRHLAPLRSNSYTRRDSGGRTTVTTNGRDFDPGITMANGGWNAPMRDVMTLGALLSRHTPSGGARSNLFETVLSSASLAEMERARVTVDTASPRSTAVGLSAFVYGTAPGVLVGHTGEQAGFHSIFLVDPATGVTLVAVWNSVDERHPTDAGMRTLFSKAVEAVSAGVPDHAPEHCSRP